MLYNELYEVLIRRIRLVWFQSTEVDLINDVREVCSSEFKISFESLKKRELLICICYVFGVFSNTYPSGIWTWEEISMFKQRNGTSERKYVWWAIISFFDVYKITGYLKFAQWNSASPHFLIRIKEKTRKKAHLQCKHYEDKSYLVNYFQMCVCVCVCVCVFTFRAFF